MPQATCPVVFADGSPCTRPPYRGSKWCSACYSWTRTHGWADPNGRTPQRPKNTVLPFLKAAAKATTDDCIYLTGYASRPTARLQGKHMYASRAVWILANGDPRPLDVLHTCHRGAEGCVNIRHLYLGTDLENHQDRVKAGRSFVRVERMRPPRPSRPGIQCKVVENGERCRDRHPTEEVCSKHGRRKRLYGHPLIKSAHPMLRAAAKATTDECVVLPNNSRRPITRLDGVSMTSSRAVWVIAHGDPGDAHVLHTCHQGEEGCINIRHLYLGDHAQNIQDMVEAGRRARGEASGHAKLTEEQVQEIRDLGGTLTQKAIAERYGVSRSTISHILRGDCWGWMNPETQRKVPKVAARGEQNHLSKLTEDDVRSIRRRYIRGSRWHNRGNVAELAEEFNVRQETIRGIVRGGSWAWLNEEGTG